MKKRQAALLDLHYDILKEILIRVAGSSNGAKDFAKAISVCKAFRQFVEDEDVLRAAAFDDLSIDGCRSRRLFQLMGGLVCRCAQAGQGQAQYILAKIILMSTSQLLTLKQVAEDQEASSSSTLLAKDGNLPKEVAQVSDFLENFLPARTCPNFIGYHLDFVKIFLSGARLGELREMDIYIKHYMRYLIECGQHDHECQTILRHFVDKLDRHQYLWCCEVLLQSEARQFCVEAMTMRLSASKGLQLLGLNKEQEEICHNNHHRLRTSYFAIMVEELDKELTHLRALKNIIERLNEASQHKALSSLPGVEVVAAIMHEIEVTKAEASYLQEYRERAISELQALLRHVV